MAPVMALVMALGLALGLGPAPGIAAVGSPGPATVAAAAPRPTSRPTAPTLARRIREALAAHHYPAGLRPAMGDYFGGRAATMSPAKQCLNPDDILNTDDCNFGPADATRTAVVLGDSVAASYLPGLTDALLPAGYRVHGVMLGACPVAMVGVRLDFAPAAADRCNRSHRLLYAQVQRLDPDLLILTDSASGMLRLASGNRYEPARREWLRGEREALSRLTAPGRKVVVLAPNPVGGEPRECYVDETSVPQDCILAVDPWWFDKRRAEKQAAADFGASYVDTLSWFSYADKTPIFVGGLTQRWDRSHLTAAYSRMLAPMFASAILGPGTAGRPG